MMRKSTQRVLLAAVLATATVGASAAPRDFEAGVLAELNRFRGDPAGYANILRTYRARFEGKLLLGAGDGEYDITTNEGVAAVDEAIRALRPEKPRVRLAYSDLLARTAADHVAAQSRSGAVGHYTKGRGPGERSKARAAAAPMSTK